MQNYFFTDDITAGCENELQVAVIGDIDKVDLPIQILESDYYSNLTRRIRSGDNDPKAISDLERYLKDNKSNVWESSWIRFPVNYLSRKARETLSHDLMANKKNPTEGNRRDRRDFFFIKDEKLWTRLPVSYALKLALIDMANSRKHISKRKESFVDFVAKCFVNDNTSPEVLSIFPVKLSPEKGMGKALAEESALRYLLIQLLTEYMNNGWRLNELGQKVVVYFSALPPERQRFLNQAISDSFYRELFMNPCLSGWDRGEEKKKYMGLCHKVLSRSHFNAVSKLRDARILNSNLVVIPNSSNTCLSNNGTHVSLGSIKLGSFLKEAGSNVAEKFEKKYGDLAIKITEHFIPMFIGTFTASPYRLDFKDFHPETVLGFLPHELDFDHLRMIWRRWKKKADINFFGKTITPFGPEVLDRIIGKVLRLKGDYLYDYRLIDYLVAPMSTPSSPSLNGEVGNQGKLKKDLFRMGVYDQDFSFYNFHKLREMKTSGFTGFEARYYSAFYDFGNDMTNAINIQILMTALAYKYIQDGEIDHGWIPDTPETESERRQIIFTRALGVPTFFVKTDTKNKFLRKIISKTEKVRVSNRYPKYYRIKNKNYCLALLDVLEEDGSDLIEYFGFKDTMSDLRKRLTGFEKNSASGKLTSDLLRKIKSKNPLSLSAREFNTSMEDYYRNDLRKRHTKESFEILKESVIQHNLEDIASSPIPKNMGLSEYLHSIENELKNEELPLSEVVRLSDILLTVINSMKNEMENVIFAKDEKEAIKWNNMNISSLTEQTVRL